ncbi:MAG: uncharacterized protein JWQ99_3301 [Blastococcus sp.]|jgi:quercetin dioxygenase-like cupin family protein|nr:uncharacterized protein [Blastococcus sp.]
MEVLRPTVLDVAGTRAGPKVPRPTSKDRRGDRSDGSTLQVVDREPPDLLALGDELLAAAAEGRSHRAGRTLPHPVDGLRQTLIALREGAELSEHESPGPASLMVVRGRVRLVAGDQTVHLGRQQLSPIPDCRHSLRADEDSVVLLSVAVPVRVAAAE